MKAIPLPAMCGGHLTTLLVLAALWLRAMVPAGYMPERDGVGGWPELGFCRAALSVIQADGPAAPSTSHDTADSCLFALAAALPGPLVPAVPPPSGWALPAALPMPAPAFIPLAILGMPGARAPPFSAR